MTEQWDEWSGVFFYLPTRRDEIACLYHEEKGAADYPEITKPVKARTGVMMALVLTS